MIAFNISEEQLASQIDMFLKCHASFELGSRSFYRSFADMIELFLVDPFGDCSFLYEDKTFSEINLYLPFDKKTGKEYAINTYAEFASNEKNFIPILNMTRINNNITVLYPSIEEEVFQKIRIKCLMRTNLSK